MSADYILKVRRNKDGADPLKATEAVVKRYLNYLETTFSFRDGAFRGYFKMTYVLGNFLKGLF